VSLPSPPSIFGPADFPRSPPSTRYQGSKFKLLDWIGDHFADLEFDTALDAFGGSGCISYLLKMRGKAVTYNDYLRFNHWIGRALIENSGEQLPADAIMGLQQRDSRFDYDDLVARVYRDIFFTDTENVWLDTVCQNIPRLPTEFQQALAYYALFQACLSKRPYNLFHRKNLYM
jgi:adenine-specific DNA methylase